MENNNLENVQEESNMVDSNIEETKNQEVATETKEEKVKTFTQDDIDRIINKTIAKERKKAEEEKTEAEKLAKMSAEEKAKHEFEKEKAKFEEERASYLKEKLELQVTKELASKNLPTEFSRYLLGQDAESSLENIKEFEALFNNALEKYTNEKLKGSTPNVGATKLTSVSKEEFMKMGIFAQSKFAEEHPDLYKTFLK